MAVTVGEGRVLLVQINQHTDAPFALLSGTDEWQTIVDELATNLGPAGKLAVVGDELMASSDAPTLLLAAGVLHNLNAALFGASGLGSMAGPFARVPTRAAKNAIHLLLLYTSGAMTSTLEADIIHTAASRIQAVLRGNGRLTHNQCCVMLSQPSSAVQQRRASGGFQTQPAVVHLTIVRAQKWNQGPTSVDYKRCPAWLTWKRQTGCVRCGEAFHVEVDHVNAHGVLVLRSQCP
eukprot:COSAG03_NODE_5716_length_1189_cov_1.199083_2_plen_234_part_01